jgi:hypothetical protein
VDSNNAILTYTANDGAVYKGLALASNVTGDFPTSRDISLHRPTITRRLRAFWHPGHPESGAAVTFSLRYEEGVAEPHELRRVRLSVLSFQILAAEALA